MPFLQRVIEPVHVCRNALPLDDQGVLAVEVPNELECVTNGTLSNIIRQLSSLSKHAENMFSCLFRESSVIVSRVNALQGRMDRLGVKVTQLDSTVEEVSLQDIHMRKAFKSCIMYEQQIVSRESMPAAMKDTYFSCDKPPPLDKLNPYREDGKDGLKFYTDPNYFFDLWKQEMLKDTEKILHDRGKKVVHSKEVIEHANQRVRHEYKKHKKSRQLHTCKEKTHQSMSINSTNAINNYQLQCGRATNRISNHIHPDAQPMRPNSLELHSSFFNQQPAPYSDNAKTQYPPPPPAYTEHPISPQQHYPPPPYVSSSQEHGALPPAGTPSRAVYSMRPTQPPPDPPISTSTSSSGSSTPTASAETPLNSTTIYQRDEKARNNMQPPPPPLAPTTSDKEFSSMPSPQGQTVMQSSNALSATPTSKQMEKFPNNIESKKDEASNSSSSSNSSKTNSPENNVKEPSIDEPDLPTPPPIPILDTAGAKIKNLADAVLTAPARVQEHATQPPPPPPPLPPIEDLVLDTTENDSISDNQNIDVISTTSESASETSSLSKLCEQYDEKLKLVRHGDGRSDLLAAIREGIKLRRVEDYKQKEVEKAAPLHDVASILARRVAMEFSDSESPSESECDSDGWEEDAEHAKVKQEKNTSN